MSQAVPVRVEEGGAPPRTTRATRIFARPSSSPAHRPRTGDVLPVTRYNIPHFDFQRAHRHDMRAEKDPRDNNTPHALRDTPQPHTVDRSRHVAVAPGIPATTIQGRALADPRPLSYRVDQIKSHGKTLVTGSKEREARSRGRRCRSTTRPHRQVHVHVDGSWTTDCSVICRWGRSPRVAFFF